MIDWSAFGVTCSMPAVTRCGSDSRSVLTGDAFIATAALPQRLAHIAEARARGAAVILAESGDGGGDVVVVADARSLAARVSAQVHGLDRRCAPLLAVTGTDGKTSVAWLLQHLLGPGAARVGTLGWHDGRSACPSSHTTPPPSELHPFLAALPSSCPGVALEASSHALDQRRLDGLSLAALIVTGIGRDHLDYHGSQAAYVAAKLRAVQLLPAGALVVCNADDAGCDVFAAAARERGARVIALGCEHGEARIRLRDGMWLLTGVAEEALPLPWPQPGWWNAWNAAAAILAVSARLSLPAAALAPRLAVIPAVPGRLELLANNPEVWVDYAHTPGAVERVVAVLRARHPQRLLVLVLGCGGGRDRGKRPLMGAAAVSADRVILTDDNPRHEDPAAIVAEILAGITETARPRVAVVHDREAAIRHACLLAGSDGVVAVLGKGHETEQIIGDERRPWDDRAFVRSLAGVAA